MTYIKVNRLISESRKEVWKAIALEFGNVAQYNPGIKKSNLEHLAVGQLGATRFCEPAEGGFLREKITEWQPETKMSLKLIDSSFPMQYIKSTYILVEKSDSETLVTQEFSYKFKRPFGLLSLIIKRRMKKTLIDGLNGLEKHLNNKG